MAALPLPVRFLCVLAATLAVPVPGRIPRVYNALITSNQNLEPSKAFPVYQPVLHDPFFPYQPTVFYGDLPLTSGFVPSAGVPPAAPAEPQTPTLAAEKPATKPPVPPAPAPAAAAEEKVKNPAEVTQPTAPPPPPNTESPIPLNQFGLPPQVLPLGRYDPTYTGFNHFSYSYPKFRFYNPFDPYNLNPYTQISTIYRPLTNILGPGVPVAGAFGITDEARAVANVPVAAAEAGVVAAEAPSPAARALAPADANRAKAAEGKAPEEENAGGLAAAANPAVASPAIGLESPFAPAVGGPPAAPLDLNLLNYAAKDPAIPNVPPPPLPDGGLKTDD